MDNTDTNSTSYLASVVDPSINFVIYLLHEVYIQVTTISWTEVPNYPGKPSPPPVSPALGNVTTNPFTDSLNIYFWQLFNLFTNVSLLSTPNQQKGIPPIPEIPFTTNPSAPESPLQNEEVPPSSWFSLGSLWTSCMELWLNLWIGPVGEEEVALSFAEQKEKRAREWARRAAEKLLKNTEARTRLAALQPLLQEDNCVKEVVEEQVEEIIENAEQGFWEGWGWRIMEEEEDVVVGEDHLEYFYMASSLLILYMVALAVVSNIKSAHRRQKLWAKLNMMEADQLFDLNPNNYHLQEPKKAVNTKEATSTEAQDVRSEASQDNNSPVLQVKIQPLPDEAKINLFKSHASQISNPTILEEVKNWQNPKLAPVEQEKKSSSRRQKQLEDAKNVSNNKQKPEQGEVRKPHSSKLKPLDEAKKCHNPKLERESRLHTSRLDPPEEVSKFENQVFSHFDNMPQSQMLKLAPCEEMQEIDPDIPPTKPKKPEKKKKHPAVPKKERTKKAKEKDTINVTKTEDKPKPKSVLNFQYDMFDSLDCNHKEDLKQNKYPPHSCFSEDEVIIPEKLAEAPNEVIEDQNDIVEKKKKSGLFNFKEKKPKKSTKIETLNLDETNISPMFQGRKMKT